MAQYSLRRRNMPLAALLLLGATISADPSAFAQSAGSGAGAGSSPSGAGSSASPGASAPSGTATSPGSVTPGAATAAPSPNPTVPQTGLGSSQVPSPGNAEPSSPANRQAAPLGTDGSIANNPTAPRTTLSPRGANSQQVPSAATAEPSSPTNRETLGPSNTNPYASRDAGQPGTEQPAAPAQATDNPARLSGGGTSRIGNLSPHEAEMASCMENWDHTTHMTLKEWRGSCERLLSAGSSRLE